MSEKMAHHNFLKELYESLPSEHRSMMRAIIIEVLQESEQCVPVSAPDDVLPSDQPDAS